MEVILHFVPGREVWELFVRADLSCLLVQLLGHGVLAWRVRRLECFATTWHRGLGRTLILLAGRLGRRGVSVSWICCFYPFRPTGVATARILHHRRPRPRPLRTVLCLWGISARFRCSPGPGVLRPELNWVSVAARPPVPPPPAAARRLVRGPDHHPTRCLLTTAANWLRPVAPVNPKTSP